MKKVLYIEFNNFHYENIPGFIFYFAKLGYEVDLVCPWTGFGDTLFWCDSFREKVSTTYCEMDSILTILNNKLHETKYEIIFVGSLACFPKLYSTHSSFSLISKMDTSRLGVIGCYHSIENYLLNNKNDNLSTDRMISISGIDVSGGYIRAVNPNYFCDNVKHYEKNDQIRLCSIGISNDLNEIISILNKFSRKHEQKVMLDIVGGKSGKNLMLSQIKKRLFYHVFKLMNIQRFCKDKFKPIPLIHKKIKKDIHFMGKVSFDVMYDTIEKSDFLLVNIFKDEITEYSTNKTSGNRQISIGFAKPCIIEKSCAMYYGFSEDTAIVYESGHLEDAIKYAISMDKQTYDIMVSNLLDMQAKIRDDSLTTLEMIIENLERSKN